MLGLGAWELGLVLLVGLVVLGPDKVPEVARKMARLVGQARRMADDVRRNIDEALDENDKAPESDAAPAKAAFTEWFEAQQRAQAQQFAAVPADSAPGPDGVVTLSAAAEQGPTTAEAPVADAAAVQQAAPGRLADADAVASMGADAPKAAAKESAPGSPPRASGDAPAAGVRPPQEKT